MSERVSENLSSVSCHASQSRSCFSADGTAAAQEKLDYDTLAVDFNARLYLDWGRGRLQLEGQQQQVQQQQQGQAAR